MIYIIILFSISLTQNFSYQSDDWYTISNPGTIKHKYADDSLKTDLTTVYLAVKQNGGVLQYADDSLKANRKVVLEAVKQWGSALKFADDSLKSDPEVVLAAILFHRQIYRRKVSF
jgi:hypothetical protein